MDLQNNVLNAESLNRENILVEVSGRLKEGETLVIDIGNNYFHQTDVLYDSLANSGYCVKKTLVNGRHQLLVAIIDNKHQMC